MRARAEDLGAGEQRHQLAVPALEVVAPFAQHAVGQGRDGQGTSPQRRGVQSSRGVSPVLPVEEAEGRGGHVGPVQIGVGRDPALDGGVEVTGERGTDRLCDQGLGDGDGVRRGGAARVVRGERVQRVVEGLPPCVCQPGIVTQHGCADGAPGQELCFVRPPHHRFIRVLPNHATAPYGLGDADQPSGALGSVPALIADLLQQAALYPDPGAAVRAGSDRPSLPHNAVRVEVCLEGAADVIEDFVDRMNAEVNGANRGHRKRHARDRSSRFAGGPVGHSRRPVLG